jgi:hypothetical protein
MRIEELKVGGRAAKVTTGKVTQRGTTAANTLFLGISACLAKLVQGQRIGSEEFEQNCGMRC